MLFFGKLNPKLIRLAAFYSVCKNRRRVLYACDAQILLGQPNVGSQEEDGRTSSTAANGEAIDTTGPKDSTRIDGYAKQARAANERLAQSRELAIYGADLNHRRLPV
ncbi:hypothetical protein T01_4763 [Trichinella spiralis]|uniref:Uncharacterized protein n=1 Tax=Trichinella spiralis TaxID=6334 RepID=A0A0V1C079_TRISP|nr:hypothetical protein T01_4763 [Trichinella spiralis]